MTHIEHCQAEIAIVENLLRAGHPDVAGLCHALRDWSQELKLLQTENAAGVESGGAGSGT